MRFAIGAKVEGCVLWWCVFALVRFPIGAKVEGCIFWWCVFAMVRFGNHPKEESANINYIQAIRVSLLPSYIRCGRIYGNQSAILFLFPRISPQRTKRLPEKRAIAGPANPAHFLLPSIQAYFQISFFIFSISRRAY